MRTLDDTKPYVTKRETQNHVRMMLGLEYDKLMNDLYYTMVTMINLEVIPELVCQIAKKLPEKCGRVILLESKTAKVCWELYNNKTWQHDPTFWMLFTSDGKLATSRTMVCDEIWFYEEAMKLVYNDDSYHHNIYDTVRIFDGLLAIGKKCDLPEITLSLWKERFNISYADYCRASEARVFQTRDD